jgi:ApaG protein
MARYNAAPSAGIGRTMSDATESTSSAVTSGIRVDVSARFIPERSNPTDHEWFFAYTITIANQSDKVVQLLSRHWVITDADGKVEEVRGPGVVGQQPVLRPGEHFEYTSGCVLETPRGSMQGTYQMHCQDGRSFDAVIAPFALALPYSLN